MATSGDVTIAQDGHAKLHPYLVALVRWCVSCLWSTATVLLHRLMTGPLPPITGTLPKPKSKSRPAGREHLHPEPKVECVVLHHPTTHNLDVVFVHGLYGSLGNTWRQGEWRSKYHVEPEKIHLRRPGTSPTPCTCRQCQEKNTDNKNTNNNDTSLFNNYENSNNKDEYENTYENDRNIKIINDFQTNMINNYDNNAFTNIDEKFYKNIKKILPQNDALITENFYNNTLLDQVEIIDNYETQAKFVNDLFKNCDNNCESSNRNNENNFNKNENNKRQNVNNKRGLEIDCKCDNEKKCEAGCGCICDNCYSPCWPKDWIKVDYPDARIISINYTSDPHLWRPIWIKETKRLCLHERAEQMMQQLLELGVGERPVIWVGHSKGGLFIKQIYCEAYEAYLKTHPDYAEEINKQKIEEKTEKDNLQDIHNNNDSIITENIINKCENINNKIENDNNRMGSENTIDVQVENNYKFDMLTTAEVEDFTALSSVASLWSNSAGFMFYSVPHRGSPLADIKTPITARSVELMEISKDCSLVLSLHDRWLRATAQSKPLVRSLVETRRTLMSVLWLRIVSADSADPGIGALCGVSVDHREICKPSSRHCLLYTELANLIKVALTKGAASEKM